MKYSWIVPMPRPALQELFPTVINATLSVSNINATLQTATNTLPKLKAFK